MEKRSIAHLEIPAADRKKSASFYAAAFGWDIEHRDQLNYTTFLSSNVRGGFPNIDGEQVKPGDIVAYIESDDLEADLRRIEELGGKALSKVVVIPAGAYAYFADPAGNRMGLWKINRPQG